LIAQSYAIIDPDSVAVISRSTERVARALYERRWREVKGDAVKDPDQRFELSVYREHYLGDARAAIAAMREPTEGMEDAGDGRIDIEVEDVYKDMASVTVHTATYHEYVHLVRTM